VLSRRAPIAEAAIERIDRRSDPLRCWCAQCRVLDYRHRREGSYQLTFWPLSAQESERAEVIAARRLGLKLLKVVPK
jgi:hypothetical protein